MSKQTILIIAIILLNITTAFAQKEIVVNAGFNHTKFIEVINKNSEHQFKGRGAYLINVGYHRNFYNIYKFGVALSYIQKNTYADILNNVSHTYFYGEEMEYKLSYLNLYCVLDRELYRNDKIRLGIPVKAFAGICFWQCLKGRRFTSKNSEFIDNCKKDFKTFTLGLNLGFKLDYKMTDKINLTLEPMCEMDAMPPIENRPETIALSYIVTAGVSFAL